MGRVRWPFCGSMWIYLVAEAAWYLWLRESGADQWGPSRHGGRCDCMSRYQRRTLLLARNY
jgi:hypothetical protein